MNFTRLTKILSCMALLGLQSCTTPVAKKQPDKVIMADNAGWQLVWQDDFSVSTIDLSRWSFEQNCWGGGNNEKQCYTNRSENAYVKDGLLHLVAKKEQFTGAALGEHLADYDPSVTKTLSYTSAKLHTRGKADWLYGRFEIRAKLPPGQGVWPAIWMLPSTKKYGGWAASGEIDIMEAVNLGTPSVATLSSPVIIERSVHGTLHHGASWPDNVHTGTEYQLPNGASPIDDFHTYAIEWQDGEIRWYVDQQHYATQTQEFWYSEYVDEQGEKHLRPGSAPFDQPFYLLINLAVGGGWPESENLKGVVPESFPAELIIDFVKVYQCKSEQTPCANIDPLAELISNPDSDFGKY
ncbi:MAG: beta-glucanase (GH16 family) [Paraglaciecola sp.]|jgi:beta-glucanase (GH16 family)